MLNERGTNRLLWMLCFSALAFLFGLHFFTAPLGDFDGDKMWKKAHRNALMEVNNGTH